MLMIRILRNLKYHDFSLHILCIPQKRSLELSIMRSKRLKIIFLILLLVSVWIPATPNSSVKPAEAWGSPTHVFITNYAVEAMPDEWRPVFRFYIVELIRGSVAPDIISGITGNFSDHLYYPETQKYTAPWGVERELNYAIANFTAGNWSAGMYALGFASHYLADIHIPVHTDEYWPGHDGYEKDINEHLVDFEVTVATPTAAISDIVAYTISSAEFSHQYFDQIKAQYEDDTSRNLETNQTLFGLTEMLLNRTVNSIAKLFYTAVHSFTPPTLETTNEFNITVLIDAGHDNDYTGSYLSALYGFLNSLGVTVKENNDTLTSDDFTDVDVLIITAPYESFTNDEINAIKTWTESGNKSIILTSRGDFNDALRGDLNNLLSTLGSHIRINDDNAYESDPSAYKPWYVDITSVLPAYLTKNLTYGVSQIRFFSPSSLWLTDPSYVTVLAYGDPTVYQEDNNPAVPIQVIYDNESNSWGGDRIILAAAEQIGTTRIAVFGTTVFSDFDFSNIYANNVELLKNLLSWFYENRSASDDIIAPDIEINTPLDNSVLGATQVSIEWSTSATDVEKFVIAVDGTIKIETTTESVNITITEGYHTIRVFAIDSTGNVGSNYSTVFIDATAPTVQITNPPDNYQFSNTTFILQWNGSDNIDIDHYEIYVNGSLYATVTNTSITITLEEGTHTIRVVAVDSANNTAYDEITITISPAAGPPSPVDYTLIIVGVVAVVVIVLVIVIIRVKKK